VEKSRIRTQHSARLISARHAYWNSITRTL